MRKLYKTIEGADCEVFAIRNHQRIRVGKATPTVEIYQNVTEVPITGSAASRFKTYEFSLIICSNPELANGIGRDEIEALTCFDLKMLLMREDETFVPFEIDALTDFDIDVFDKWVFNVNDHEVTKALMAL